MRTDNSQNEQLLTVDQVAAQLSLVPPSVYRLIWRGDLPSVKIGRAVRVRRSDVATFIKNHVVEVGK